MKPITESQEMLIENANGNLKQLLKESIMESLADETEIITVGTAVGNGNAIIKDIEPILNDEGELEDVEVEVEEMDTDDYLYYSYYYTLNKCSVNVLLALWEWIKVEAKQ